MICCTSLHDWSRNSRHSLNQSDLKLKPITTWSPAFSRALGSLVGFILSSHWLLRALSFLLLAFVITLVLIMQYSIEKRSNIRWQQEKRPENHCFPLLPSYLVNEELIMRNVQGSCLLSCFISVCRKDFSTVFFSYGLFFPVQFKV